MCNLRNDKHNVVKGFIGFQKFLQSLQEAAKVFLMIDLLSFFHKRYELSKLQFTFAIVLDGFALINNIFFALSPNTRTLLIVVPSTQQTLLSTFY